jgi:hypothetical protein
MIINYNFKILITSFNLLLFSQAFHSSFASNSEEEDANKPNTQLAAKTDVDLRSLEEILKALGSHSEMPVTDKPFLPSMVDIMNEGNQKIAPKERKILTKGTS